MLCHTTQGLLHSDSLYAGKAQTILSEANGRTFEVLG